jgi:hypothetical protein
VRCAWRIFFAPAHAILQEVLVFRASAAGYGQLNAGAMQERDTGTELD